MSHKFVILLGILSIIKCISCNGLVISLKLYFKFKNSFSSSKKTIKLSDELLNLTFSLYDDYEIESFLQKKKFELFYVIRHNRNFFEIVKVNCRIKYHVSLSAHGLSEPLQVKVYINGSEDSGAKFLKSQDVFLEPNSFKTVDFQFGDLKSGTYQLNAEGLSGLVFHNTTDLEYNSKSFSVLVQTDKAIYKPADMIRFRVLVLDANTKPYVFTGPLNVYLIDGKSNRVKQWLDVKTTKGVFSSELQLSDAPVLGDWKFEVELQGEKQTKTVEVAEYVLPKFEVTIDTPPHGVFKDGKIRATVRSKYTYGKPVKGEATISAYPTLYIGSVQPFIQDAIARKVVPIDGKATVEFDIKEELKLDQEYERDVIIEAIVEEELTGRRQNGTGKTTLHKQRHKIEFVKDAEEYKPGLPFNAWVKVSFHDGTPVQDTSNPVTIVSNAPVLGDWKFEVELQGEKQTKTVEVAEYVLPKFEVTIDTPPHGVFKDGKIRATVRSKYTYGKPVKGEATISAYPTLYIGSVQPFIQDAIARKVVPIDGKATVEFDIKEELKLDQEYERDVIIEAIVEEELTGRRQNGTGKTTLHKQRHKIEFVKDAEEYKPGLPFNAWVKVSFHDGTPVQDTSNPVTIATTFFWRDGTELNQTVTLDGNGMAPVNIIVPEGADTLNVRALYMGVESYMGYIKRAKSESKSYLRAKLVTESPEINSDVHVDVKTTEAVKELFYQVLGRGDIIASGVVQVANTNSATFKFLATFAMVPKAQLVVFYIRPDGELVSDRVDIPFSSDLANFVKLDISKSQARPGEEVQITVSTKPNSYVGLLGIDQSVLLLKKGNDLSKDEVFEELQKYDSGSNRYRPWGRWKRDIRYPWEVDRYEHFEDAGMVILTNARGEKMRRKLPHYAFKKRLGSASGIRAVNRKKTTSTSSSTVIEPVNDVKIRKNFIETWIFDALHEIGKEFPETFIWDDLNDIEGIEGIATLNKKVPDTITSWVISAFSVDPISGLGLTQRPKTLNVFQPFFVSLNLPYSVKRGEIVSIPVVVFNYMESDQTAEVTLHNTENEFEFVELDNEIRDENKIELSRKKSVTIKANSGSSAAFIIRPKKVGHITIKVTAQSQVAGDGVERQLLVKPEGVTQYVNEAVLVDLRDSPNFFKNLTVKIPKNAVPDSTRIEVTVVGDILGPTIKNLDKLIKMPYGCGEQNMLNFVPNIVVLDYLKTINQLTPEIEGKAKKFMESGYQRELTYKHKDGSFSAFGENDKSGSTWLTAFVAKSFRHAAKHIDVEESVIKAALQFLADTQAQNGSFPEPGKVSHKDMQGGSGNGLALTAYTLITFLENKNEHPEFQNNINRAIDYLVKNIENLDDIYAIALTAYALELANHNAKDFVLTRLDARAMNDGDTKYWNKPIPKSDDKNPWYGKPNSVNVEMTAYALLAYLQAGQEASAFPILKWLVSQRNENGGFQSTQDTVVGLQALAKLGARLGSGNSNIQLNVLYGDGKEANINVDPGNSLLLQSYLLPETIREVNFTATGKGVSLAQLAYRYNVNVTGEWPRFTLDPQVSRDSTKDHLHLTVCTSYVPLEENEISNMAVMEVEFPSGFTADLDSLPSLENYENVKRVETKDGDTNVILYFDNLERKETCPTIRAFRTHKVAKQKPAAVVVYDYYDNSRQARMFYKTEEASTCDICEGEECAEKCSPQALRQQAENENKSNEPNVLFKDKWAYAGTSSIVSTVKRTNNT
uniref:CD109 antigen n=1 Tax=Culicoides sonorensis TaxID=179676 RepID=A0A336LNM3_CULSO